MDSAKLERRAGESLAGIGLLAGLEPGELAALEAKVTWLRPATGDQILTRESRTRDVLFIVQGQIRIVSYSATGREVAYARLGAGDYAGEFAALDGEPRSASAVALEPCLIAQVSAEVFRALLEAHPKLCIRVIEKLIRVIRDCDERIMDLATLGAYQRVYREILKRAKPDPLKVGSWLVYPMPTQMDIASHASTTRETVARVLSYLAQSDVVGRKGKTLYIRDRSKLEQLIQRTDVSGEG